LLVIVAILLTVAFTPLFEWRIRSGAQPAADYEQAMAKARELLADEGEGVNPVCRSRVLDQGQRSAKSVVLLHGFTNCPKQFDVIADAYAAAGYSVVIPRLPGHGKSDRLTKDLSDITPQALADSGNRAVDIAAGLGEQVEVVGLSGGGTVAAYLAHERDEVTEAVLIAPLVIPRVLPEFAVAPVARLFRVVPDVYLWWDSAQKDALATPPYAYPRYSLRALGAFLALGRRVQNTDPGRATGLDRLVVVTNANDAAVNAAGVADIADAVAVSAGQRIDHLFPASEGFKHDIIDPRGENADKLAQIYPTLGQLLGLQDLRAPMRP
jgi:carboxylesterase